jgi:exosome complex component CSL4
VIRLADVRLTERDKIKMGDCFRLGDSVKARVVSWGEKEGFSSSLPFNSDVVFQFDTQPR